MNLDFIGNTIWIIWMLFILTGYFLIQTERIQANTLKFININFIWSILLLFSLHIHFNLASYLLECVYISISIYWYYRYFSTQKEVKETN